MLHPEVRSNLFEVERLSEIFNEHLADCGYELVEQNVEADERVFVARKHIIESGDNVPDSTTPANKGYHLSRLQRLFIMLPYPGRTRSSMTRSWAILLSSPELPAVSSK